ncbi:MAG: hypothetical protein H9949_08120 [Candidatus Phocaeicola merdigallinarum]|jgi:hypothetical protein|nr:hypothetical protein [Candidatus Phocaeicola merdigallinarum]
MGDIILRGWNWCRRFRHRRGYGVHSPSDFFFITFVVYERLPFYAYGPLHHLRRVVAFLPHYREKVDKFLFRLVNYLRPSVMWEIGTGSGMSTRYMAEAHADMQVYTFSAEPEDAVKRILSGKPSIDYRTGDCRTEMKKLVAEGVKPEIVHIAHTTAYKEVYEQLLPLVDKHTCFVIGTPYATPDKKKWWKEVIADPRTGVTFDLYDVGLVFFDKERVKEHRIVNFL